MHIKICTILILLFMLQTIAMCQQHAPSATAGLMDDTLAKRNQEYTRICNERRNIIDELIAIMKRTDISTDHQSSFNLAVELLGQLRAKEAIYILSNHLMYLPLRKSGGWEEGGRSTEMYYVCAQALVDIGEPSIEPMLWKVRISKDMEERNLAAWVIMSIEGKEQALHRFETLITQESTGPANYNDRYEEAKQFIGNYEVDHRHPLKRKMDEEKARKASGTKNGSDKSSQAMK